MAFRRPRVNVKPNVQATRPVGNSVRSQDTSIESISTQSQEEQSTQQIDLPVTPPIVTGKYRPTRFYCILINKSYRNKLL
jgi:hypothetical protein